MTCEEFKTLAAKFSGPMLMSERIAMAVHCKGCAACLAFAKAKAAEETAVATPAQRFASKLKGTLLAIQAQAEQSVDEELRLP